MIMRGSSNETRVALGMCNDKEPRTRDFPGSKDGRGVWVPEDSPDSEVDSGYADAVPLILMKKNRS